MGALFGTDGIRGIVNQTLDAPLAYRVGQAAALVLAEQSNGRPLFLIGKDTRISSDLLEDALTAGLLACGADVMSLGIIPHTGSCLSHGGKSCGSGRCHLGLPQSVRLQWH